MQSNGHLRSFAPYPSAETPGSDANSDAEEGARHRDGAWPSGAFRRHRRAATRRPCDGRNRVAPRVPDPLHGSLEREAGGKRPRDGKAMKSISLSKKESWSSEAPVPPSTIKSLGRRAFDCGRDLESFLAVRSKGERDADERWRVGGKALGSPKRLVIGLMSGSSRTTRAPGRRFACIDGHLSRREVVFKIAGSDSSIGSGRNWVECVSGSPIGVTKLVCSCRQKRSLQRLRRDDPLDTSRLNLEVQMAGAPVRLSHEA